jgi:serine/threonine protein kinase
VAYYPGRSLAQGGWLFDVCNAIEYAHSRGVLHRDRQPGNIIVGKHGETLVVDWGLAKAMSRADPGADPGEPALVPSWASGSAETLAGGALGTPGLMSPEQAAGDLEQLGPRPDVHSLGTPLDSSLTGRTPVAGTLDEVLDAVKPGRFPPPRRHDATRRSTGRSRRSASRRWRSSHRPLPLRSLALGSRRTPAASVSPFTPPPDGRRRSGPCRPRWRFGGGSRRPMPRSPSSSATWPGGHNALGGFYKDTSRWAEAKALSQSATIPLGDRSYQVACVLAVASGAVRGDAALAPADRAVRVEALAARAVEHLARARDADFFRDPSQVVNLRKDSDPDSLRSRRDFQRFLADLTSPDHPFAP